jgi:hypothetical protein
MGKRWDFGPGVPSDRPCAPFVLAAVGSACICIVAALAGHEARTREPVVSAQTMLTRQSRPQRVMTTAKISVRDSSWGTAAGIDQVGSPMRGSTSASPSLEVESNEESLVVASLGACRFEPGGEGGGSVASEGLDPEPESDRTFKAGAGPVVVPVGSFVLVEMSAAESAAASEGSAPEASVGVAARSVVVTPSDVSVAGGVGAHVPVVSAAAIEVSVVPAEVSVVSVAAAAVVHTSLAHASVVSAAATEVSVVPAEVSVACVVSVAPAAVVHASVVSVAASDSSVAVAEVSVASGAVAHVSVVFDEALESAVVAEVSVASGAVVHAPVVFVVPEVSVVESDDVAGASETDGEGFSARAVAANRDAQRTAASTATVQPTNPRARRRSKRRDRVLGTATELPSISASSPWRARCSSFEYCT